MKHQSQGSKTVKMEVKRTVSLQAKMRPKVRFVRFNDIEMVLTRGVEVFVVLSSLLWAVEAIAGEGRSLSSLAIPGKKPAASREFIQYSEYSKNSGLNRVFLPQLKTLPTALGAQNGTLTFQQSPYFVQAQFEFTRFPTFLKK